MSERTTFEYAAKMTTDIAADYLSKLAEAVSRKSFEINGLGKSIDFSLDKMVRLELKAVSKEKEGEIQLEISWKEDSAPPPEKLEITPVITEADAGPDQL
jgi:amphi-Trp domain-containing protein